MPSWSVVIVFAVLASCAAVVIAGYFRGNRKIQEAARWSRRRRTASRPSGRDRHRPTGARTPSRTPRAGSGA